MGLSPKKWKIGDDVFSGFAKNWKSWFFWNTLKMQKFDFFENFSEKYIKNEGGLPYTEFEYLKNQGIYRKTKIPFLALKLHKVWPLVSKYID